MNTPLVKSEKLITVFHYSLFTIHCLQQFRDDRFRCDAFGFGTEVGENAMPEDRVRHHSHIIKPDGEASVKECASLCAQNQRLPGSRACAPTHILVDESRRLITVR